MKPLDPFDFKPRKCLAELKAFDQLLKQKKELDERKTILPFFKKHQHLAAFIGSYLFRLNAFDKMKLEFEVFTGLYADIVVGDSKTNRYCFIEFEDAKPGSIFKKQKKGNPDWSNRFEHGFSQLVDWFSKIDDMKNTRTANAIFGGKTPAFMGVLVIGRDQFLGQAQKDRLAWRAEKVTIDSNKIVCVTYDELARELRDGMRLPVK
jgi:hypothetical protein